LDLLDKEFLKESIRELTTIMSKEWIEEVESSSEAIHIHTPSLIIQCNIRDDMVGVHYNPTVGANVMSTSFASAYFCNEPHDLTNKALRIAPRSILKGLGFYVIL
jgi:hypothetical protein